MSIFPLFIYYKLSIVIPLMNLRQGSPLGAGGLFLGSPIFLIIMIQYNFYLEFISQMPCNSFSCIYTSMLATGTTKIYHQTFKTTFDVIFHADINNTVHTV